ncbi:hypothetical protein C5167_010024 [Papaver somniferum]|uniref:Uncharacterized protein n=1 Tax=Papaver somniferum TaxID=3469 RepID=A0A4Y7K1X0_PAPSO|nr:hypothetical protein C5167_010024 [Papaver somniferum]
MARDCSVVVTAGGSYGDRWLALVCMAVSAGVMMDLKLEDGIFLSYRWLEVMEKELNLMVKKKKLLLVVVISCKEELMLFKYEMKARNGHGFDSKLFEALLQLRMEAELQVLVAMQLVPMGLCNCMWYVGGLELCVGCCRKRESWLQCFHGTEMGMLDWKNLMLEQRLQKKRSYKWWFELEVLCRRLQMGSDSDVQLQMKLQEELEGWNYTGTGSDAVAFSWDEKNMVKLKLQLRKSMAVC